MQWTRRSRPRFIAYVIGAALLMCIVRFKMPAYTTVRFQFGKESRDALVRSFYKAFTSEGLAFSRVHAWGCRPDLTLDDIIEWNQQKLDEDFELGYDEDVSHDYRQVLLADHPFSECRVYI